MIPDKHNSHAAARGWLMLGVMALATAGIFSILIVVARTPQLAAFTFFQHFFHEALVVHVDLSVLVWFLSIAGMLFSLVVPTKNFIASTASLYAMAAGSFLIALSPFFPDARALMSNYIPVITNIPFFLGLGLIAAGALIVAGRVILSLVDAPMPARDFFSHTISMEKLYYLGVISAAMMLVIALACFAWSVLLIPSYIHGEQYYEMAFWAGGHILQFAFTQLTIVAWLCMAEALGVKLTLAPRYISCLLLIALCATFAAPIPYILYEVYIFEFADFFTQLMITANGLAPAIMLIVCAVSLVRSSTPSALRAVTCAFGMSLIVFAFGGLLGIGINGQNVKIPAHYHGSIVGTTLAFMGLAYLLLPRLGYASITHRKLAFWQPITYGAGQIIHISALAYSGGYGVLRKTPGAEMAIEAKIAMGIMGMGGLIAIIGGIMFVVVMWQGMRVKNDKS